MTGVCIFIVRVCVSWSLCDVIGSGVLPPFPHSKVSVLSSDSADTSESATFQILLQHLHQSRNFHSPEDVMLYLHTKGTFHVSKALDDWRQFMLFHNVWLYRWALVMLQHYETYGVDLHQNKFGLFEKY